MIRLFRVFMSEGVFDLVKKTLDSGYVGQGPMVEEFEKAVCELEGIEPYLLATMSGTHALDLAYHLCEIGHGSEVISTPMTCSATNTQLLVRGARIVWADVDPYTGLIDPEDVARKCTRRTKAIVAVDWGGAPCDYAALKQLKIPVIQDGAHSLLADTEGGDYRMWSFQAIKHLTTGDGGALLVPKDKYERAYLLRWYGLDRRCGTSFRCIQDLREAGYKYGMNDVAASIGLGNISYAKNVVGKHKDNALYYVKNLKKKIYHNPHSSYWLFTLLVDKRDEFISHMKSHGIEASPVHDRNDIKTCFRYSKIDLPGVEEFSRRQVNIPVGWWLTEEERKFIVEAVNAF